MRQGRVFIGLFLILLGLSYFINIPIANLLISLFVIWVGIKVIRGTESWHEGDAREVSEDTVKRVLIFSPLHQKVVSSNFQGAEVVAIFGGGELDLSGVKTKKTKITIELTAIFGGIKVILPPSWCLHVEGVGMLGGFSNTARQTNKKGVDAIVKGVAILGGVEVTS